MPPVRRTGGIVVSGPAVRHGVTYPAVADHCRAVESVRGRICYVVLFFEILLGLASVLIVWFALYTVYRLVNDES